MVITERGVLSMTGAGMAASPAELAPELMLDEVRAKTDADAEFKPVDALRAA